MFPTVDLLTTKAFKKLKSLYKNVSSRNIKELFENDGERFAKYSIKTENILFDYSKNNIDEETLTTLIELANECGLPAAIEALFTGQKINKTEDRAVLHTALRNQTEDNILVDGYNIMQDVQAAKLHMLQFCKDVHNGVWKGYTGKKIK